MGERFLVRSSRLLDDRVAMGQVNGDGSVPRRVRAGCRVGATYDDGVLVA